MLAFPARPARRLPATRPLFKRCYRRRRHQVKLYTQYSMVSMCAYHNAPTTPTVVKISLGDQTRLSPPPRPLKKKRKNYTRVFFTFRSGMEGRCLIAFSNAFFGNPLLRFMTTCHNKSCTYNRAICSELRYVASQSLGSRHKKTPCIIACRAGA